MKRTLLSLTLATMLTGIAAAQTASYSLEFHASGSSVSGGGTTGISNGMATADASVSGKTTRSSSATYMVDERLVLSWSGTSVNPPTVNTVGYYTFTYYMYAGAEVNFTLPPSESASSSGSADTLSASASSSGS